MNPDDPGLSLKDIRSSSGDAPEKNAQQAGNTLPRFSTLTHLFPYKLAQAQKTKKNVLSDAEFELVEVIGKGGMGAIVRARHVAMDRLVAIKMILPEQAKRAESKDKFIAEALVTGELDHPNIVPVYTLGKADDGSPFYAMKEVHGRSWKDVIHEQTSAENLQILLDVSDAVSFAHDRGYVHRDLKPENVMLGDYGEVFVMDWGLAVTTTSDGKAERIAAGMSLAGTPAYMAPEMAGAKGVSIGPWSDIYLLGGILYEICTGLKPHGGGNANNCIVQARTNQIQPTDKKGEFVEIALKAMATDPKDRYRDVKEFQAALRECQAHSESTMLCERAAAELKRAEQNQKYDSYAQAVYGYRQALDLWGENREAARGLAHAQLAYATCAYQKENLNLAASLLDDRIRPHQELLTKITAAIRLHEARQKRVAVLRAVSIAAGVLIFVGAAVAAIWIGAEQRKTDAALISAKTEEAKAMESEKKAIAALATAQVERDKAVVANLALVIQTLHAELMALSPEYDGNGRLKVETGEIVEADFSTCRLDSILPLKDLKLRKLDLSGTRVWDLTPIAGQPITSLHLHGTGVSVMAPVATLPKLEELHLDALRHMENLDELRRMKQLARISGRKDESPMPAAVFWKRYDDGLYFSEFQRQYAQKNGLPLKRVIKLDKGIDLAMILIPPGEFMMGTPQEIEFRGGDIGKGYAAFVTIDDERPQHRVKITRPFYMGVWEMTKGQCEMGLNMKGAKKYGDPENARWLPVSAVSWSHLTDEGLKQQLQKFAPQGMLFRLPTEAEWEYACRAGTKTNFFFGDTLHSDQANINGRGVIAGGILSRCRGDFTCCGLYPPNAWGLHDMHGNILEWCQDVYSEKWYGESPREDPVNLGNGSMRVIRGGYFDFGPIDCRSADRQCAPPQAWNQGLGFRLVLSFEPKTE